MIPTAHDGAVSSKPPLDTIALQCSAGAFRVVPDARVRWLERKGDFTLVRQRWAALGASMTRSVWNDIKREDIHTAGSSRTIRSSL